MDGFQAFAWECKDYADGWIRYFDEQEALAYQRDTGCIIRVVYRARTETAQKQPSPAETNVNETATDGG